MLSIIADELGGTNEGRSKDASGGSEIFLEGETTTKEEVGNTEGECCIHAYDSAILSHTVSHFPPHPPVSGEKRNSCHPQPTILTSCGTL
jgi:hypothetical protein